MTDRLLFAIVLVAGLAVVGRIANARIESRLKTLRLQPDPDARTRILVFSGPGCSACHTQRRIVDDLVRDWPQPVAVRTVDAVAEPELAGRLGILVVPTTVIAAPDGRIVGFNGGLVETDRLTRQRQAAA